MTALSAIFAVLPILVISALSTISVRSAISSFLRGLFSPPVRWDSAGSGHFYISNTEVNSWRSVRWKLRGGRLRLKAWMGYTGMKLGEIEDPRPDVWYRSCLGVDMDNRVLSMAVNGKMLAKSSLIGNMTTSKLISLKNNLHIGVWYKHKATPSKHQFSGAISNIQIYEGGNLSSLSLLQPGCGPPGDFLAWQDMDWNTSGDSLNITDEDEHTVCRPKDTYEIAFPSGLSQQEALTTCQKLGGGRMTTVDTPEELAAYLQWFTRLSPSQSCQSIWTPYSDADMEGEYVNIEDGEPAAFLAWYPTEPDGGVDQNAVAIMPRLGLTSMVDTEENLPNCFSCVVNSSFSISHMGACKDTYLGNIKSF